MSGSVIRWRTSIITFRQRFTAAYFAPAETTAPLTAEAEREALEGLMAGDRAARTTLIEHNLRLVVYIARRFENTGVGLEDLCSIGTIGLIKAIASSLFALSANRAIAPRIS